MNPKKIKLIAPSEEMKYRIMAYRDAFLAKGEKVKGAHGLHQYENFEDWLRDTRAAARGQAGDRLPASQFVALRLSDNVIVGMANIRHYVNAESYHNGHIGYSVRPEERRKGYGTEILRLALLKAEQLGIIETVVTCNQGNVGSRKVIENNGLVFENTFLEDNGNKVLIYVKR